MEAFLEVLYWFHSDATPFVFEGLVVASVLRAFLKKLSVWVQESAQATPMSWDDSLALWFVWGADWFGRGLDWLAQLLPALGINWPDALRDRFIASQEGVTDEEE